MAFERAKVSYGGGGSSNLTKALSRSPAASVNTLRRLFPSFFRTIHTRPREERHQLD